MNIFEQSHQHWFWIIIHGNFKDFYYLFKQFHNVFYHHISFNKCFKNFDHVHFLKNINFDGIYNNLFAKYYKQNVIKKNILYKCHHIDHFWAQCHQYNVWIFWSSCVFFSHMTDALFMPNENEIKIFGIKNHVKNKKNNIFKIFNYVLINKLFILINYKYFNLEICLISCHNIISWKICSSLRFMKFVTALKLTKKYEIFQILMNYLFQIIECFARNRFHSHFIF